MKLLVSKLTINGLDEIDNDENDFKENEEIMIYEQIFFGKVILF